jgi:hypothetical protein
MPDRHMLGRPIWLDPSISLSDNGNQAACPRVDTRAIVSGDLDPIFFTRLEWRQLVMFCGESRVYDPFKHTSETMGKG